MALDGYPSAHASAPAHPVGSPRARFPGPGATYPNPSRKTPHGLPLAAKGAPGWPSAPGRPAVAPLSLPRCVPGVAFQAVMAVIPMKAPRLSLVLSRVDVRDRLPVGVPHDVAAVHLVGTTAMEIGGWSWPWPPAVSD